MTNNSDRPREYDAVLGENNLPPATDAVLGGIEGVKYRLASDNIELKVAALSDAMNYGDAGLDLVIAALKDQSQHIQQAGCILLQDRPEKKIKKALQNYNPWLFLSCLCTIDSYFFRHAIISSDGQTIFSGEFDTIRTWDLKTGTLKYTKKLKEDFLWFLSISLDGKTLVSVGAIQEIKIWDVKQEKIRLRCILRGERENPIVFVALSPDGQTLFSGTRDSGIQIWDLKTEDYRDIQTRYLETENWEDIEIQNLETGDYRIEEDIEGASAFAISPDGQTLLLKGKHTINIWDAATENLIHILRSPSKIYSLAISSDRKILIGAFTDNTINIWDVNTGNLIHTLKGHSEFITSLVITPDGRSIISGSLDTTIRIWDVNTGKLKRTLEGHLNIHSIPISLDGRAIIISDDRTIKIWGIPEV